MSEAHDIIGLVVDDRAPYTADPILNLRTGEWFTAEIEGPIDPIILATELGDDLREAVKLHVRNPRQAACIALKDRVKFALFGQTVIYEVVKRVNDAASPFTVFWAQRITKLDQ